MPNCFNLKKSNCKNCYKCIRNCPVKAIKFSGNQAHIIGNECILCGKCFVVCPQKAKEIVNETEKVKVLLQGDEPVIVSLAPSFIANYPNVGIGAMRTALKKLGFTDVEETAIGATIVKNEYERMVREEERDVIITSCCHSVNLLIQKYFPTCLEYLADVLSPMQAHCQDIKKRYPNAKTVFIGPCVAKKDEAEHYYGITDAVLTYEELSRWLAKEQIELKQEIEENQESRARLFPTTGGVLKTMTQDTSKYTYLAMDGVENCIKALKEIESGKIHKCFIEMSACEGSCINGPVMEKQDGSFVRDYMAVTQFAGKKDFLVTQPEPITLRKKLEQIEHKLSMPLESEIQNVLREMGKTDKSAQLNCGSCGYNTCLEKAIAICQGKAEISMCMPLLKDKAESFSDTIVKNTPNGLLVLNESLEIQQINESARIMMNIRYAKDVLGEPVIRILEPKLFMEVLNYGKEVRNQRTYLAEYKKYIEYTIIHDKDSHLLIVIMSDVTIEEKEREKKENITKQTIEVADKVVEKQMRIVQEIASLLGETAAETKIALSKLKESISTN